MPDALQTSQSINAGRETMPSGSVRGGRGPMDSLPPWAVSAISVAVGLSPGLAILVARPLWRHYNQSWCFLARLPKYRPRNI